MGESEFWAGLATIATLFAGAGLGGRLLRWTEGKLEAFFAASAKADMVPAPEREESLASLMFGTRPSLLAGLGVVVWGWALWEGRRRGFDEAALEKGADGILFGWGMMLGACACLGYQWPEKRLAAAQAAARLGSRAKGLWSDLWRAKR